jgi:hypothetical protein
MKFSSEWDSITNSAAKPIAAFDTNIHYDLLCSAFGITDDGIDLAIENLKMKMPGIPITNALLMAYLHGWFDGKNS